MSAAAPEPVAPSPRKLWITGAVALAVLAAVMALKLHEKSGLPTLWFDALQIVSPRQVDAMPATIVAIDDASIEALGQWPWPRTTLARLIDAIVRHEPVAIGVDILMSEADRLSPEQLVGEVRELDPVLAERLAALPTHDAQLARSVAAAPVVMVLVEAPAPTGKPLRVPPVAVLKQRGAAAAAVAAPPPLARLPGAIRSIDELDAAASGHGVISSAEYSDVIRRLPLVLDVGGTLAPALALEMLRVAQGEPQHRLHVDGASVRGISVGELATETESDGTVRIYYSRHDSRRFVSAIDVLRGKVEAEQLASKLVLVGMTASALLDNQLTPLRERMPGSEIHAQLLENLLGGTLLVRPRWAGHAELAGFILLGMLLIWATPRWRPGIGALIAAVAIAVPVGLAFAAFRTQHWLIDAATPALGLLLLFGTLLWLTLGEEERQRKSLERVVQAQREREAYVAGELKAAHNIQTGILPRADLLAGESRVDLAATMTPAREVGGDLYDFFRLDGDRLFFLVGDVAGKGLSASIFMAVSKALYKSEVLRSAQGSAGAHMTAANAEISRDNSESFFVTAFAGILDLASGELAYCNAGHENPWVRVPQEAAASRLEDGGGPPLCVIDDFVYEDAGHRMRPGAILVVVSDGVTEAQNTAGELYGIPRLEAVLARIDAQANAAAVVEAVRADVAAFVGAAEPSDDLTLLVVRWVGA